MEDRLHEDSDGIVAQYRALARISPTERTDKQRAEMDRIESDVRLMERASQVADEKRGFVDQDASSATIEASAVLFTDRLRALAEVESDEDIRDLLLEIPKLMGEYLQTVTQHESAVVMASLFSTDTNTYQARISNYDRARRARHQSLMTRINMAVKSAVNLGIEPLVYREVSKDVLTSDRFTIADYSRNVLSLFG